MPVLPVMNYQLGDLDVNVSDTIFGQSLPALEGHDDTITARERSRRHTNPEYCGECIKPCGILFDDDPDADDMAVRPFQLHRVRKGDELGKQASIHGLGDWVADPASAKADLLGLMVSGHFPRSGASASNKDRGRLLGGHQASILELGLLVRQGKGVLEESLVRAGYLPGEEHWCY